MLSTQPQKVDYIFFQNRGVSSYPILEPIHFWQLFADKIHSTAKTKQIWLEIDSGKNMKKIRFLKIFMRLGWGMPNDVPNRKVHTLKLSKP